MKLLLDWKVGVCDSKEARPKKLFDAAVPGAVQLDYAKEFGLPDYNRGLNFNEYRPLEDKFWLYKTEYDASDLKAGEHIFLVAKGIDYRYKIYANNVMLCDYEGMYKEQHIDLTEFSGTKISIEILVYPVPKSTLEGVHKESRDEANQCCKPAVSYGWDFHPRLIPLGIWDEIYIEKTSLDAILKADVCYELSDELKTADVKLNAVGSSEVKWELCDPDGNSVFSGVGKQLCFTLDNVVLWWCNGYGKPSLYTLTVSAGDQTIVKKIGFKRVELIKAEGSWNEMLNYPMSRNTPPITVRLNNNVIFAKGSNWVCPEIFYGTLDSRRYREQLELVKNANMNFLRCWGGAVINKESFFDICDELGIMIWQEFPLACNDYQGTKHYMSVLKSEATEIITRIKNHACLMLWCGGNELFNNWSCMTDQCGPLRLLGSLTFKETPEIPFIPTSPVMGMAHGPYSFNVENGREVIDLIAHSSNTAYTEFGGGGFSTMETLLMIADKSQIMPLSQENEVICAHGTHILAENTERYFGKTDSLEALIGYGQLMQSVVQQFIFEESRRQKPYCSIVSNWCFNEPWPNVGNNSLVCYPNNIKPAYYAVARACRSVLASARYRKFSYKAGEILDFDLFLLNDSLDKLEDGAVDVYVKIGDGEKLKLLHWEYSEVEICKNAVGPTVRYKLPEVECAETLKIILDAGDYSSEYTLLYSVPGARADGPKKMNAILDENM